LNKNRYIPSKAFALVTGEAQGLELHLKFGPADKFCGLDKVTRKTSEQLERKVALIDESEYQRFQSNAEVHEATMHATTLSKLSTADFDRVCCHGYESALPNIEGYADSKFCL
jgi:hypothetical protein